MYKKLFYFLLYRLRNFKEQGKQLLHSLKLTNLFNLNIKETLCKIQIKCIIKYVYAVIILSRILILIEYHKLAVKTICFIYTEKKETYVYAKNRNKVY